MVAGRTTDGPIDYPTYARNPERIRLYPGVSWTQDSIGTKLLPQGEIHECPTHAARARGFD